MLSALLYETDTDGSDSGDDNDNDGTNHHPPTTSGLDSGPTTWDCDSYTAACSRIGVNLHYRPTTYSLSMKDKYLQVFWEIFFNTRIKLLCVSS